jgi:RNA polymerase sigma factor (sigma-70 family)
LSLQRAAGFAEDALARKRVAWFGRVTGFHDREGRLSRSDEQRFRELYDRTHDRLWAFVLRRISDNEAAADVVSDTYLAVWRRIPDVPLDARGADAWVFSTARKVLANSVRGTKRRVRLFDRLRQRPVDFFVQSASSEASNALVFQALERIRPKEREILTLAYWDEFDIDEIALILGCSKNAAAVRLTRARRAWRDAFEEAGGER